MSSKILILTFIVFFVSAVLTVASAQESSVYLINAVIFNNDTVILKEISTVQGSTSHFPEYDTGYKVEIYSKDQTLFKAYLPITFIRTVSPPMPVTPLDNIELSIRLPYFSNADHIFFYHGEKTILKIDLQPRPVCGNNICETTLGENSENCPQDCPVEKPKTSIYVYLIIIGIIIAVIALFLYQIRVAR